MSEHWFFIPRPLPSEIVITETIEYSRTPRWIVNPAFYRRVIVSHFIGPAVRAAALARGIQVETRAEHELIERLCDVRGDYNRYRRRIRPRRVRAILNQYLDERKAAHDA